MGVSRRTFTREMKTAAVRRLENGSSVAEVARAFEVNPNTLYRWQKEFREGPGNAFPGTGIRRWDEAQVAKLERKVGQQTLEIDF
jgi:transposase